MDFHVPTIGRGSRSMLSYHPCLRVLPACAVLMLAACTAVMPAAQPLQTAGLPPFNASATQNATLSSQIPTQMFNPTRTGPSFDGDPRLMILRDVVYATDNAELQSLDAYLVIGDQPSPVVVEIHGGGWRRGTKSQFELYPGGLIESLIDQGISVVSINYRLTPEDVYPAQVQDVQRAIQFIRLNAKEWNIDPQRMAVMGGSAGAHLSAWIALHDDLADPGSPDELTRQSTRVSCFVDLWGPMDLTRVVPAELALTGERGADFADAFADLFGTTPKLYNLSTEMQILIREASPLYYVSPDDPLAMIVHNARSELATEDHPPVPGMINDPHSAWFGVMLADAMQTAGIPVVRYIGPEVGNDPLKDAEAIAAFLQSCLLKSPAFP